MILYRCNIPVVIMGETGCGKTRLIRYMCNIAARGCKNGGDHVRNMLIMKVHILCLIILRIPGNFYGVTFLRITSK